MTFAVTNRQTLAYGIEVTQGAIPAIAFQSMRVKSQTLNPNQTFIKSNEIRSDFQVADQILTDQEPGGDVGFEVSYGTPDDIWMAQLRAPSWTQPAHATYTNVAATAASKTFTVASGGTSAVANHLVYASGFTNAGNNGVHPVASSTGTTIVTTDTLTDETAGTTKTVKIIGFQGATGDITATSSGLASTTLDFTTLGMTVGQYIVIGGAAAANQFAQTANNTIVRVNAIAAHALTLDCLPSGWATDTGTGKTIRVVFSDFIQNGTTVTSLVWERDHPDVTASYFDFLGMRADKTTISFQVGQILESTTTFKGMTSAINTTSQSTGSYVSANSNAVMNATANVVGLFENHTASGKMKSMTLSLMNNLRSQKAVGTLGNAGIGDGQCEATMQVSAYFVTGSGTSLYSKYLGPTQTSLAVAIKDNAGNYYVLSLPAVKLSACNVDAGQINQDVMLNITAAALRDTVTGVMVQIDRVTAYGA